MSVTPLAQPAWVRAYRPLGARTLLAQLAIVVAVEALLLWSYGSDQAGFHWATHFLVGLAAAGVLNLAWLALKGAPMRGQLLSILVLHLYAMFPDVLFAEGVAHDDWMDVFLGHNSSHHVPGGVVAWLVVALASSGVYASVLSRWLRARQLEARSGAGTRGRDRRSRPAPPPGVAGP